MWSDVLFLSCVFEILKESAKKQVKQPTNLASSASNDLFRANLREQCVQQCSFTHCTNALFQLVLVAKRLVALCAHVLLQASVHTTDGSPEMSTRRKALREDIASVYPLDTR